MKLFSLALLFKENGKLHRGLAGIAIFMVLVSLANAAICDPRAGFDASDHIGYIRTLVFKHRLPEMTDTTVYYSPPLPYVLPSLFLAGASGVQSMLATDSGGERGDDVEVWKGKSLSKYGQQHGLSRSDVILLGLTAKVAHIVNWLLLILLAVCVLKICELVRPGNARFKALVLLMLATLPVIYKSFTNIRGEPVLAAILVMAAYWFLSEMAAQRRNMKNAIILGVMLGFAVLSRQWAFLVLPVFFIFAAVSWRANGTAKTLELMKMLTTSIAVAAVVGGWFYVSLKSRYGGFTAIPRAAGPQYERVPLLKVLSDGPPASWTSLDAPLLFSTPVRPSFGADVIPIMYTETWGDYFGTFVTTKAGQAADTVAYLARVNVLSLVPTAVMGAGMGLGAWMLVRRARGAADQRAAILAFLSLFVFCAVSGYLWWLLAFPDPTSSGIAVKPVYLLHVFPMIAILAGEVLEVARRRSPRLFYVVLLSVIGVGLHNLPTMITHYVVRSGELRLAW